VKIRILQQIAIGRAVYSPGDVIYVPDPTGARRVRLGLAEEVYEREPDERDPRAALEALTVVELRHRAADRHVDHRGLIKAELVDALLGDAPEPAPEPGDAGEFAQPDGEPVTDEEVGDDA